MGYKTKHIPARNFYRLSGVASSVLFYFLRSIRNRKRVMYLFMVFTVSLSGCFRTFYNPNTKSSIDTATLSKLITEEKYFVIHFNNSIGGLEKAYLKNDSLFGRIVSLPPEHKDYLHPVNADTSIRIKSADKQNTLIEVHLYTSNEFNDKDSLLAADVSSFNRADVYELNKKTTRENHVMSIIGVSVLPLIIIV